MTETNSYEELQTLRDFMRWGASRFVEAGLYFGHGMGSAIDESVYLVLHAVHLPPDFPEGWFDTRVSREERSSILQLLQRRINERKPAAYLTGEGWFCGLPFMVNEHVLVPRSPISELIEAGFQPWLNPDSVSRVLDLCTGSGCIGIAAAYAFPGAEVDLGDISPEAIDVAWENIHRHGLDGRVRAVESDLFDGLTDETYDLIISNPPYVDRDDLESMPEEFHHEPELGLAAGDDGLDLALRILHQAPEHLNENGVLVVEVGNSEEALMTLLPEVPFLWPHFERGGHGVFILAREQLIECRQQIEAVQR
jgi:ribosomal protein L3 glutamine methyltransferase